MKRSDLPLPTLCTVAKNRFLRGFVRTYLRGPKQTSILLEHTEIFLGIFIAQINFTLKFWFILKMCVFQCVFVIFAIMDLFAQSA